MTAISLSSATSLRAITQTHVLPCCPHLNEQGVRLALGHQGSMQRKHCIANCQLLSILHQHPACAHMHVSAFMHACLHRKCYMGSGCFSIISVLACWILYATSSAC